MLLLHYFLTGIFILFITPEIHSKKNNANDEGVSGEAPAAPSLPNSSYVKSDFTRDCWTIRGKDVNHFRLFDGYLNFRVKAAHCKLSFYSIIDNNMPVPTFEINLGTTTNDSISAIHRYYDHYLTFNTPSVLKAELYRGFWVRWNRNGVLAIGKEGETLPFMAIQDYGPDRHSKTSQLSVYPQPLRSRKAKWLIQVPNDSGNCEMKDGYCERSDSKEIALPDNYKTFCEYLQMPQKVLNVSKPLNTCDGKYKEIITPIGGEPSKFKFLPVENVFNFGVKAEKHAELVFLETLKSEPYFTIVLASQEAPSTSSLWITNEFRLLYDTRDIINKDTHSYFWVRWDHGGHIAMGHATDDIPFMVTVNPKMPQIRYVALTTYTPGSFVVEDANMTDGKPVRTRWQDRGKGEFQLEACAVVGGYVCEECDPDPSLFCRHTPPAGKTLPLYVARVPDHAGIIPGHWLQPENEAIIVLNNKEQRKEYFQILVSGSLEWVRYTLKDIPHPYPAGKTPTAEHDPLYICRSKLENDCIPGYVAKSGHYCAIAYKGKAYNMTKYDILACTQGDKCPTTARLNDT